MSLSGPEAQDALLSAQPSEVDPVYNDVPASLARATSRLQFPPSYVVVGAYRLFTDKNLYIPAWAKCQHGVQRGAIAGLIWTFLTFGVQKKFIEIFLANSPRVTGLSTDTMFGYKIPFNVHTYAAVLMLGSQLTYILRFFLSRNIRIARERAWDQTVASRGKGPDFWGPYVEEWTHPPRVVIDTWSNRFKSNFFGGVSMFVLRRVLLIPFNFYPGVGILLAAWFKSLRTAHNLHRQYFTAKKMTPIQIETFMEERKWDYRAFGFAAALLEGLPVIGLLFTISNRVGAAMWAHDLEKRQHFVASKHHT
ncbi:hypothetical protein FB45DRAFT_206659 [Roridomyces roridus]|uniref:Uncharacterized protein n=1 Tax=Roridomyces roridus TaxID=1738132 RepID=A0AAD7G0V5_9AGAR|nr:hypothetical protein FB45DRAFT_206659 [Roridomyces roridus]